MDNLKMDNLKDKVNYILLVEIIILGSLNLIKKMEEGYISGQENNQTYIKVSS